MSPEKTYFTIDNRVLHLGGTWTLDRSETIVAQAAMKLGEAEFSRIDSSRIEKMDSWGAYFLKKIINNSGAYADVTPEQRKLLEFIPETKQAQTVVKNTSMIHDAMEAAGQKTLSAFGEIFAVLSFIGQTSIRFLKNFGNPRSFRFHSIIRHIDETGLKAVPIIALLAILTTMVISYQAATQLQKFGANIFTVDLTVISLLREMGVLITAIMVAGRSGSAFAAEIGVMKLREEVDALRTIGMDPFEVLVLPRVLALMISLPILTFIADMVGIAGGSIISMALLDIPLDQYIDRVQSVAKPTMFFVGMVKAPVFAFIIAIVGTYQGMNITGSAESVGKLTTVSVVQSIFLVIMADALFSILFAQMDI
ncbi:MAG: ABC transporter permease [Micavibrio aeruginosavorus]|uniref:ABC transporter permease n=1 Tax=Micavibrio aeruginosavorus TaxID=349221 RepID=A0A2W5FPC4_9BACT|nr:MAG: ABC transporter permease [Micavibrio aeruginosavorus]